MPDFELWQQKNALAYLYETKKKLKITKSFGSILLSPIGNWSNAIFQMALPARIFSIRILLFGKVELDYPPISFSVLLLTENEFNEVKI
jgi:hypothetical protein